MKNSKLEQAFLDGVDDYLNGVYVWKNPYFGMLDEEGNVYPDLRNAWFDGWHYAYSKGLPVYGKTE